MNYHCLSMQDGDTKPNVVLFVVDDMGMGDVGCFGNDTIKTPNIDRIGKDGAILTHHLAADALCTPSRAAFLTGRYPIRSGMACNADIIPVIPFIAGSGGLPKEETTIAELARQSGYTTALFGKWHEGLSCREKDDFCHHPLSHGFDVFYGCPLSNLADFGPEGGGLTGYSNLASRRSKLLILIRNTSLIALFISYFLLKRRLIGLKVILLLNSLWLLPLLALLWALCNIKILNGVIMRNYDVVEQPIRLENFTRRIVAETTSFMKDALSKDMPFLIVVNWFQVHVVLQTSQEFSGHSLHGQYGDNVEEMDWGVGEVLRALERLNQLDNTFVYLTSDNGGSTLEDGPGGGCHGGYNGIFRGQKGHSIMDGGIRVPAVAMWKDHIQPGTVIDVPTSLMDILPTLRESVFKNPVDEDIIIDGENIYPILAGVSQKPPHKVLLHYCCREVLAARYTPQDGKNVYKVYFATLNWIEGTYVCPDGPLCDCSSSLIRQNPPLVYNIGKDPSESEGPIPQSDPAFHEALQEVDVVLRNHRKSLNMKGGMRENQMNALKLLPRPWLQPCCNFPWCHCNDPVYPDLKGS